MELFFEHRYPHPIEKVWKAITTSEALAQWLMRNDFAAEVGRACVFRFCPAEGEEESLVHVTVLELDPPRWMKWRWRNEDEAETTTVTFELEPADEGTVLRLRHSGPASPFLADRLRAGWPEKLAALGSALAP
jgi:uncharacterized protein YndB with AHSA1/START domain